MSVNDQDFAKNPIDARLSGSYGRANSMTNADGRQHGADEFMWVTERVRAFIEESPEALALVEAHMKQWEADVSEELRAAVVGRDFMSRRYTL